MLLGPLLDVDSVGLSIVSDLLMILLIEPATSEYTPAEFNNQLEVLYEQQYLRCNLFVYVTVVIREKVDGSI
jgi:hypothetical protein